MKNVFLSATILAATVLVIYLLFRDENPEVNVLVFSKTEGFRHQSIAAGKKAIIKLGETHNFSVDTTENSDLFRKKNLEKYQVVIFLNTTGDVLNEQQQHEFMRYIQAGGGFVGIHAAADTEYQWPWYNGLVGAYFESHPSDPNVREATINKTTPHDCTNHLADQFKKTDEWYNYKNIQPHINVLLNLDENSYEGGTNGENHPITWLHEYDGGRAFYTGFGHTSEAFADPDFRQLIYQGIEYAAGDKMPVDYSLASVAPEESRFVSEILDQNLNEPMEMEILPNGDVLFIERNGKIKLNKEGLDSSIVVHHLNVHTKYEDGLLGLAIDPDYEKNSWIYLYYSPVGEKAVQHVSRFFYRDGMLNPKSEIVVLEIPVQRLECCHSAGSLEFGPDENLFISTGDDTNPFKSNGFSPSDERPGRYPWDAQKSSANMNDLRGKILRITPQDDGSYTIPDGNLFDKNATDTRPEIYVMGCRNPFRFAIDSKTRYLYWGDVGPDAGNDKEARGFRGHDEVNQAKKPGFFGWPYFIGNNKPYKKYDFATKVTGEAHDPKQPINQSPNNTGPEQLPPAQSAFIWYPYAESEEFPMVGKGGRNAMAGGVYHTDAFSNPQKRIPNYYDGKLFTYDWMRGFIMAVTLDDNQDFSGMERFLPGTKFSHPVDFKFGPDGDLYILEYGNSWFKQNQDAVLRHIKYIDGNRKPVARFTANKVIGAMPLKVKFDASGSEDFDGDELRYRWIFTDQDVVTGSATPSFEFTQPGVYNVRLIVTDKEGETAEAVKEIKVGNDLPEVAWKIDGNQSFYFDNRAIDYQVNVADTEDGNLEEGIDPARVAISFDFLKEGADRNLIAMGHQKKVVQSPIAIGKSNMEKSDCSSCHQEKTKSIGPSYQQVAKKYKDDSQAIPYLTEKIINGGGGVWGEQAMSAHPQLSVSKTELIVKWILSLSGETDIGPTLPPTGKFVLDQHTPGQTEGTYIMTASYTDRGGRVIGPLTKEHVISLRSPIMNATYYDEINVASKMNVFPKQVPSLKEKTPAIRGKDDGYVVYKGIDLTDIKSIELTYSTAPGFAKGGEIIVFANSLKGKPIGKINLEKGGDPITSGTIEIDELTGYNDLYLQFKSKTGIESACVLFTLEFMNEPDPGVLTLNQ